MKKAYFFKYLLPVEKTLIKDAYLICDDEYVFDYGEYKDFKTKYSELKIDERYENDLILPAFVNAHTHLVFGYLKGKKLSSYSFGQWVIEIIATLNMISQEEMEVGILDGVKELTDTGVLTIGDISINDQVLKVLEDKKCLIGGKVFLEYICMKDKYRFEKWDQLEKTYDKYKNKQSDKISLGLSPHSLYTITKKSLEYFEEKTRFLDIQTAMHFGESIDEKNFLELKKGPLYNFISKINPDFLDSPIPDYLEHLKLLNVLKLGSLMIHYNDLAVKDIPYLKSRNISIVHCPRSHEFFQHPMPFKLYDLLNSGINVALGTDSLASNTNLNFFEEIQTFKRNFKDLPNKDIIKIATMNGGIALNLRNRGVIKKNQSYALMILDGIKGEKEEEIYESIIFYNKIIDHYLLSKRLI